jgi:hypothetical protein
MKTSVAFRDLPESTKTQIREGSDLVLNRWRQARSAPPDLCALLSTLGEFYEAWGAKMPPVLEFDSPYHMALGINALHCAANLSSLEFDIEREGLGFEERWIAPAALTQIPYLKKQLDAELKGALSVPGATHTFFRAASGMETAIRELTLTLQDLVQAEFAFSGYGFDHFFSWKQNLSGGFMRAHQSLEIKQSLFCNKPELILGLELVMVLAEAANVQYEKPVWLDAVIKLGPLEANAFVNRFETHIQLCPGPNVFHTDQNGLVHSETGQAASWSDGWGFYALNGGLVHSKVFTSPDEVKLNQIANSYWLSDVTTVARYLGVERMDAIVSREIDDFWKLDAENAYAKGYNVLGQRPIIRIEVDGQVEYLGKVEGFAKAQGLTDAKVVLDDAVNRFLAFGDRRLGIPRRMELVDPTSSYFRREG